QNKPPEMLFPCDPPIVADLHIHSTASDGEYSPSDIASMLSRNGIRFAALADHDSIGGFREFEKAFNAATLTGVELSVEHSKTGLHLLAYGFDPGHGGLNAILEHFQQVRYERIQKMCGRLAELGMPIRLEDVQKHDSCGSTLGRPHIARALMSAGYVRSFNAAFLKYIGDGKPAYIPKPRLPFEEARQIIRDAGGISILAHPGLYLGEIPFETLMKLPVDGFEVYHPNHSKTFTRVLKDHCIKNHIPYSGGSDFHDLRKNKYNVIGKWGLSADEWERFKTYLNAHCAYKVRDDR
ncbi:MAG: PHP domain-containing protein, partial [FCB group bacterium]|nr:PHP domain-containing protein [FCB group bacterium]